MFKWSYKYKINPDKGTIVLSPTWQTWMKALAPNIILVVGFGAMYAIGAYAEKKENEALLEDMTNPENE
jgi:hypothetical protein